MVGQGTAVTKRFKRQNLDKKRAGSCIVGLSRTGYGMVRLCIVNEKTIIRN